MQGKRGERESAQKMHEVTRWRETRRLREVQGEGLGGDSIKLKFCYTQEGVVFMNHSPTMQDLRLVTR